MTLGLDTYCLDELRTGRLVSGALLVGQNVYHFVTTPQGTLRGGEEEDRFGYDLAAKIGSATSDAHANSVAAELRARLLQHDERIDQQSLTVTIVSSRVGPEVSWRVTIKGETAQGPFRLVLGIEGVTVELLGLSSEASS